MRFGSFAELPATHTCLACGKEKPIAAMIVVHERRSGDYLLRSRCKDCHNARERGHRREWKTGYLRRWRKYNSELTESYWRKQLHDRISYNLRAYRFFQNNHLAILIQGRLRRRAAMHVTLDQARDLLKRYGPCYPTRFGLTSKGFRECERIRSRLRRLGDKPSLIDIRMMVYADGLFIKPRLQRIPFEHAAKRLSAWHASRRANAAG